MRGVSGAKPAGTGFADSPAPRLLRRQSSLALSIKRFIGSYRDRRRADGRWHRI